VPRPTHRAPAPLRRTLRRTTILARRDVASRLGDARRGATEGLRIELLGPPRVTVDGAPLRVDTRKAIAVLAVLSLDGPTSRERLAALLWPDSDERRARGALRRTLSVLVGALHGRWVTAGRQDVTLGTAGCWIDHAAAVRVLHADPGVEPPVDELAAAIALHRGELLEGFELRDSVPFDDWRRAHAERVRRELCRALDRLSRAQVDRGDLDGAVASARRWVDADPLGEAAHARLMLLHAWRGERDEAVRRYRECAAVLDRELGVRPLARTTALYQAIVDGRLGPGPERPAVPPAAPSPRPATTATPSDPGEPPLMGREAELTRAADALLDRDRGLVTIAGEAGIGKTRLVEELEARLHRREVPVLRTRCHVGETGIALGPVVEILRDAFRSETATRRLGETAVWVRREGARLLPQLAEDTSVPQPTNLDSPGAKARFLDAVVELLTVAVGDGGTAPVLILEDVQHADDATIDVLVYALHRLSQQRLRLLLTWREGSLADAHPLRAALVTPELVSRDLHVRPTRLTPDEVRQLARSWPTRLPPATVERLVDETEGLPLAVVEYLRSLSATDRDVADDDWPIPSGLFQVIAGRLDALSETASQLATAASVLGHGVDVGLLGQTAGRSDEETVAAIEELQAHEILRPGDAGTYDFDHEKVAAVAYERASPVRRRLLHARAAAALAARSEVGDARHVAGAIATHARLGGDPALAARWEVRAAEHATRVCANADALVHLERALELDHPDPSSVHHRIARLLVLAGDYPAALARLETAAALASDTPSLAAIEHELGGLHLRCGRWEAARAHLDGALHVLGDDPGREARIRTDLGLLELRTGRADDAERTASTALRLAERAEDLEAIAQARNLAGLVARRRGEPAAAQRHLEHAAALASSLPDPSVAIAALNNLALATDEAGDPDRARELLVTAIERCERLGDHHRRAALHNNLADLLHREGDEEGTMTHLKQAVSLFAEVGGASDPDPEVWKLVDW
jgi:DNA-binding SARP family transcriptional activator/tetratricopeptide (TPR) repeat protein